MYTANQLLRYHAWAKTHPDGELLRPGGDARWSPDRLTSAEWLSWFFECLTAKINRLLPAWGKGNRAAKRAWAVRKARVRCFECGEPVGDRANPNASHNYCNGCTRR